MKATASYTTHHPRRFTLIALFALWFLCHIPQVQAQTILQEEALTSADRVVFMSSTRGEARSSQALTNDFEIQTDREPGSGNASGGEDDDEEDVVFVLDGYQSIGSDDRLTGSLDGFDTQTEGGDGNASGGEDDDEEDVVIVLDGYQSISGGDRLRGQGLDDFAVQTERRGGNASGGEDDDEEDVVFVLDGYQSIGSDDRLTGSLDGFDTQTEGGDGNASGGEDDDEEDVVIVLDGYQSVSEADVQSSEAQIGAASELPQQATLQGNYPNPFNPSTTIRFELPEAQAVRLVVYNAIGQQVQVLVDGSLGAGLHEVRFEAGHLASGLYLARLETPTGVSVQRMMLAK